MFTYIAYQVIFVKITSYLPTNYLVTLKIITLLDHWPDEETLKILTSHHLGLEYIHI
jgi:hypothetical protein